MMNEIRITLISIVFFLLSPRINSQDTLLYLIPEALYDGVRYHENAVVEVQNGYIVRVDTSAVSRSSFTPSVNVVRLTGLTLMPGMIEGHAHILLHPYNETPWNDQVLKESLAERAIRAANHVQLSLEAGITTMRDLGSEGAGYLDVGIKQSIEKGLISGPDLIVAGPAIVTTGSYGPKGFSDHVDIPLGAHEADGYDDLIKEVRRQIGGGADVIKVYADYRWGPQGQALPTFTQDELDLIVEVATSSGRNVVAHAATAEGMRRATLAGVQTIEHGDGGTRKVFELMKERGVALCPTLAAGDAILQYRGWRKGIDPIPERIVQKRKSFGKALEVGVSIVAGGDVGVFPHGDNVREFEMMVDYGMSVNDVLQSVTSGNADILGLEQVGRVKKGLRANLIAVRGNPLEDISLLRNVEFVMKHGEIIVDRSEE